MYNQAITIRTIMLKTNPKINANVDLPVDKS